MIVVTPAGDTIEIGTVETAPTIGIVDYSRRVTDDFGVTTVVERGFARRMSVKLAVPSDAVDALQDRLADLRAVSAQWIADARFQSLSVTGFFKDFSLDLAAAAISYCTLTVEGLAVSEPITDTGADPAPEGASSTLQMLAPVAITDQVLVAASVAEDDQAEWSAAVTYPLGARVMKAATHRVYESAAAGNIGNDPAGAAGKWTDIGPTKRWAMFDQALGTATTASRQIVVTFAPGTPVSALAVLDVEAATVRVQSPGYDRTQEVTGSTVLFLDMPLPSDSITVTIDGPGALSVGTLLIGRLAGLGITEAAPSAGITDYSRKTVDDFGNVSVVERAFAKRMSVRGLIRTDAIDDVASRIAAVRARPSLWIGKAGLDTLTIYGFFKDFSIEVGQSVSKLSLTIEGLSKSSPLPKPIIGEPGRDGVDGKDGKDGRDGRDGLNGSDGAPGDKGADGRTSYVHYAYANSPDGTLNFAVGAPEGRTFVGTYADFTAADSTDPMAYRWSRYAGPASFGLASTGAIVIAQNRADKIGIGAAAWDAQAYSTEGWRGGAQATFRGTNPFGNIMAGLNSDPTTNADFTSIDYAWLVGGGGVGNNNSAVYINGVGIGAFGGPWDVGNTFQVIYDNRRVRWLKDGGEVYSIAVPADLLLYFDSSILEPGVGIKDIGFTVAGAAGSDGRDGLNGDDGTPGEKGADGRTSYVHYAYANSADGTVNFAIGAPEGRTYIGSYADFTAADSPNPAAYRWALYAGPASFGLAGTGQVIIAQNSITKNGPSTAWDVQGYSTEGWRGGAQTTFRGTNPFGNVMAGLNTDPSANASFDSLDYAWHVSGGGVGNNGSQVFMNGAGIGAFGGPWDVGSTFQVIYDNRRVRWLKDGGEVYSVAVAPNLLLYFDSSILEPNVGIKDISFGSAGAAGTDGRDGLNGTNGAPGRDGINGGSAYFHVAYADSADGSINFTTGAPGARTYLGVAVDQNAADPETFGSYAWSLIKGRDGLNGNDGTPGVRGADGRQSYVHFAYSNSPDGSIAFSTDDPSGRAYIGVYSDFTLADSGDYHAYTWSLAKGADGTNGANGADGFSLIASPAAFVVPSFSNGTSKPAWTGGSCRIALIKGGQEIAADSYSYVASSNISSIDMSGQSVTFSDVIGDKGEFTARATRGGVSYDLRVTVVRTKDGSAAFSSSTPMTGRVTATGRANTTVPGGRSVSITAGASYDAPINRNGVGVLSIYWRNVTDGGPDNFLGSFEGSIARTYNVGTPTDPEYETVFGYVGGSAQFTSPSPDKLIEYFAGVSAKTGSALSNISGEIRLEVMG